MSKKINTKNKVSTEFVAEFEKAFNHLNAKLFNNRVPSCMITFNRNRMVADGMFIYNNFQSRQDKAIKLSEIALNTDNFHAQGPQQILAVLTHEMCHYIETLERLELGKDVARSNYHTKHFANIMKEVGLHVTSDGTADGKQTGDYMTQLITPMGLFETESAKIIDGGFKVVWQSELQTLVKAKKSGQKPRSKAKPQPDDNLTVDDAATIADVEADQAVQSNHKPKAQKVRYKCECKPVVYANVDSLDLSCNKCGCKFTVQ